MASTYSWQCLDCKTCCVCSDPGGEEEMVFCDRCDRGYHTFCVDMRGIPEGGLLECVYICMYMYMYYTTYYYMYLLLRLNCPVHQGETPFALYKI